MYHQKNSFNFQPLFFGTIIARVAELVDAHGSGSCVRKNVLVRFQSRVLLVGVKLYLNKVRLRPNIFSGRNIDLDCTPTF